MKVGVLYGGTSAEREVSLSSGKGIMKALKENGHDVIGIDFHPERLTEVMELDVDIVFIGLHGRFGEDGRIQGLLDMLEIPYVGSGVLGSAVAMDKAKSKKVLKDSGIRLAKDLVLHKSNDNYSIDMPFGFPVVVKPNSEGSTIGLTIAQNQEELNRGIEEAFRFDNTVILEEFISGTEVTVAVMGEEGNVKSLPVVEIVPKNAYYDYESKYAEGGSEHIVPARISESYTEMIQQQSVMAHELLGCETYSRVDYIVPNDGTEPVFLEVNTLPGMTPTSLYPDAAKEIGYSYEQMIEHLIQLGLKKK
ncbi:D-alanine--D-alanine ligase family protein [Guptibacillus hwajinpoensis]|uniref:D-alanine--D-alanine ligase n=1 Tax=Guptibacillus hwajinpoensis TaxID=208199 RepID=A0A0J6D1H8_9BACL|nr:D-alanine--D-alanine ligase [Alkalihalobacillus macyae]KMM38129.1 D-alanine--D-alanine ligase [Alkalihalobacillus macyae]